jgi:fatty-acyl-CoA synthase
MLKIVKLFHVLYKIRLLSPLGIYRLLATIYTAGINVLSLLKITKGTYANKIALVDDFETISYQQLSAQSEQLSIILFENYHLRSNQKVGFLCRNHASFVKSIFAVSRLGADIYLLNSEMSHSQLKQLVERHNFDILIHDFELSSKIEQIDFNKVKIMSYHDYLPAINNLVTKNVAEKVNLPRASMSKIILLTGGTTGNSKEVPHKPSLFRYLNPFIGLLTKLNLLKFNTAYIATPIYHGYGVAILFLFMALGKKIVITKGFDARKACALIRDHKVEVVTVVPLMIHKMLKNNPEDLRSLSCIASGSAVLPPKLVNEVFRQLGDVLFNLYGTSEAGLIAIATPEDLRYSSKTIGKKINGVRLNVLDSNREQVEAGTIGQLCIKNGWSLKNRKTNWIETGDLGYQDHKGCYFLSGRTDDMVVSAGVNVYPIELEQILINHPQIDDVAVIGISDEEFGQRLKVFVNPVKNVDLTKEELYEWLRPRVARFQVPKDIVFVDELPYTPLGKLDKRQLK